MSELKACPACRQDAAVLEQIEVEVMDGFGGIQGPAFWHCENCKSYWQGPCEFNTRPGWMGIESAPKDRTNVLLYQPRQTRIADLGLSHKSSDPSGEIYTGSNDGGRWRYTCAGDRFKRDDYFGDSVRPTHWMPLPDPPA